jgi:hypothetical protein
MATALPTTKKHPYPAAKGDPAYPVLLLFS